MKSASLAFRVTLAVIMAGIAAVLGFARFGDPRHMPVALQRLAIEMRNPRVPREVPPAWAQLCRAWDSWLPVLQRDANRLLRTEGLWAPNDPLRRTISAFMADANARPESLVPQAAQEKRLAVLAELPREAVLTEMQLSAVRERVSQAAMTVNFLVMQLEMWPEWDRMRSLLKLMQDRGFTRAAAALRPRLPPARGDPGYDKVNVSRTLKLFDDVSLDVDGTLRLFERWREFSRLASDLQASGDPEQQAVPARLLNRLTDQPTLVEFADSLAAPLEEMRRRSGPASVPDVRAVTGGQEPAESVRPLAPVRRP